MIRAVIIFLAVYVGLVAIHGRRWLVAWVGIAAALIIGALAPREIIPSINWNVLGIFAGTLVLAELFIISKVPEAIADMLINRSANLGIAFLSIIAFTSLLSMFIENVAAVLIVAPVALQLARKASVSPVPVIIGLAITSNLQGTATLIGDPPSMILAAAMKMNFMDFILYRMRDGSGALRPGIFWFVQIGAVVSLAVLLYFFKGMKRKPERIPVTSIVSLVPSFLLVLMIALLVLASFIDPEFVWFGGLSASCSGSRDSCGTPSAIDIMRGGFSKASTGIQPSFSRAYSFSSECSRTEEPSRRSSVSSGVSGERIHSYSSR